MRTSLRSTCISPLYNVHRLLARNTRFYPSLPPAMEFCLKCCRCNNSSRDKAMSTRSAAAVEPKPSNKENKPKHQVDHVSAKTTAKKTPALRVRSRLTKPEQWREVQSTLPAAQIQKNVLTIGSNRTQQTQLRTKSASLLHALQPPPFLRSDINPRSHTTSATQKHGRGVALPPAARPAATPISPGCNSSKTFFPHQVGPRFF